MVLKYSELEFFTNWLIINIANRMLIWVLTMTYIIEPYLATN